MSSSWGKFLLPITVPTGGWDFVFDIGGGAKTATVPAGTYNSILELCAELEDQINAQSGVSGAVVTVSSTGTVSIYIEHAAA